jgi:hypothetical protein
MLSSPCSGTTFVGASARDGGFFIPQVRVNQYVEEGELLGRQVNVYGDVIHKSVPPLLCLEWQILSEPDSRSYTASASGRIHTLVCELRAYIFVRQLACVC